MPRSDIQVIYHVTLSHVSSFPAQSEFTSVLFGNNNLLMTYYPYCTLCVPLQFCVCNLYVNFITPFSLFQVSLGKLGQNIFPCHCKIPHNVFCLFRFLKFNFHFFENCLALLISES